MAKYTAEAGARLRDIAYAAGISVDRLLKLNPDLVGEDGDVNRDIEGMELRLGKDNEISKLDAKWIAGEKLNKKQRGRLDEDQRDRYRNRRENIRERRQEKRNERLMQDTGFAAFMRQMGFDASEIENSFLDTKERLRAERQKQMPLFADQAMKAEERVNLGAEASGMFRSGRRLSDVSDAVNQVDVQRQEFLDGLRETRREAREAKNSGLAALERDRAEQEIAAAERLTQRDAQTRFGI